jgi:hypothetical protein
MNLVLNYEGFEEFMVHKEYRLGGVQYQFRFDNGYGASVVKARGTYGYEQDLWELAVLTWDKSSNGEWDYDLNYYTPITDDVVGYCTDQKIREYLQQIKDLGN